METKLLNRENVLSHLWFIFLPIIFLVFVIIFFVDFNNLSPFDLLFLILAIDPAISFYLYISYIISGRFKIICIEEKCIKLSEKGNILTISNNEISKITFHITIWNSRNAYISPFYSNFYFVEVNLKDGNSIVLTCLQGLFLKKRLKEIRGVVFEKEIGFPEIN